MRPPDFRGDKDIVARNARGAQPLAYLNFVFVNLRGVDVSIAKAQRLLDKARASRAAEFPGAEAELRNFCAIGFDDVHCVVSDPGIESARSERFSMAFSPR